MWSLGERAKGARGILEAEERRSGKFKGGGGVGGFTKRGEEVG